MNATGFVALVVVLAFGIGFFVAAIIWLMSWAISPKEENALSRFFKDFGSKYKRSLPATNVVSVGNLKKELLVAEKK
jgi:hypothetical protein